MTLEDSRKVTMAPVEIIFYKEDDGSVPMVSWLREMPTKPRAKCVAWIKRLHDSGHELRRPYADYLRDGIYELRIGLGTTNYRILYYFYGGRAVVLSHGLSKERVVPRLEIDKAIERKKKFERDPPSHIYLWGG
jgi:phage-related protein